MLTMPISEAQVRALRIDDTVTLQGTLFGIRDGTQIAMFDRGVATRFDLRGHAVIHTAPNVKKVAPSPEHPVGYAPVCVGTTTSSRMERFTRPLLAQCIGQALGRAGCTDADLPTIERAAAATWSTSPLIAAFGDEPTLEDFGALR